VQSLVFYGAGTGTGSAVYHFPLCPKSRSTVLQQQLNECC